MMKIVLAVCIILSNLIYSQVEIVSKIEGVKFYGIHFFTDSVGFATSYNPNGLYRTTDGGRTWVGLASNNNSTLVNYLSSETIFYTQKLSPYIYSSNDLGVTWENIPIKYSLKFLEMLNDTLGFILTDERKLYQTTNGGIDWTLKFSFNESFSHNELHFVNSEHGWTRGRTNSGASLVLLTKDGGNTWNDTLANPITKSGTTMHISDVYFFTPDSGFSISGSPIYVDGIFYGYNLYFFKTTDRGNTWVEASKFHYGGESYIVEFLNKNFGCIDFFHTIDGGYTWNRLPIEFLVSSMHIVNENMIWISSVQYNYDSDKYITTILKYSKPTSVGNNISPPLSFQLFDNYPNPFNLSTSIQYYLEEKGFVVLDLYNVLGEHVQKLVEEEKGQGLHSSIFEANNLTSGIYFYQLRFGNQTSEVKKMMLLK